jgi:hypothetical protein
MKSIALLALVLLATPSGAPPAPHPGDFPTTVHVTSSPFGGGLQQLDVLIDGKPY